MCWSNICLQCHKYNLAVSLYIKTIIESTPLLIRNHDSHYMQDTIFKLGRIFRNYLVPSQVTYCCYRVCVRTSLAGRTSQAIHMTPRVFVKNIFRVVITCRVLRLTISSKIFFVYYLGNSDQQVKQLNRGGHRENRNRPSRHQSQGRLWFSTKCFLHVKIIKQSS